MGVATVQRAVDGPLEGVRCKPYDYTGKWIVGVAKWKELVAVELRRVRGLGTRQAAKEGFLVGSPSKGDPHIYYDDGVARLPGVGKSTAANLASGGIATVHDVARLVAARADFSEFEARGLCRSTILKAVRGWDRAGDAIVTRNFQVVDHRKADNPYQSRFGNAWEAAIGKAKALRKHECVTHLWLHVLQETASVFRGTTHEDTWMVYHDALTHLTDKSTAEWMRTHDIDGAATTEEEQAIFRRWVLPVYGLNNDIGGGRYASRPVGNSPELMPLDCNLFQDLDFAVNYHVAVSKGLADDNPAKFSRRTPKAAAETFKRIWTLAPDSVRIVQDVTRCWTTHLHQIREARGCMVPGIGNHNGRRRVLGVHKHGGHRTKKPRAATMLLHPDTQEAVQELIARADEVWARKRANRRQAAAVAAQPPP